MKRPLRRGGPGRRIRKTYIAFTRDDGSRCVIALRRKRGGYFDGYKYLTKEQKQRLIACLWEWQQ